MSRTRPENLAHLRRELKKKYPKMDVKRVSGSWNYYFTSEDPVFEAGLRDMMEADVRITHVSRYTFARWFMIANDLIQTHLADLSAEKGNPNA